jgi:Entner-Doudoroff aldolase
MLLGAGTVTSLDLAKKAVAAGATYIVSPGFNPSVVDWCVANNVPVVPGVCTPSDIEQGLARNLSVLKFFPAEASGGINMLKNFAGPFPQLKFMPTGGINLDNLADYAKTSNVLAVGGSWMVKADLIEAEQWDEIADICHKAVVTLQGLSFAHMSIDNENPDDARKSSPRFPHSVWPPNGAIRRSSWARNSKSCPRYSGASGATSRSNASIANAPSPIWSSMDSMPTNRPSPAMRRARSRSSISRKKSEALQSI